MTRSYYCLAKDCDKPRAKKWFRYSTYGCITNEVLPTKMCDDHLNNEVLYFDSIEAAQLHIAKELL